MRGQGKVAHNLQILLSNVLTRFDRDWLNPFRVIVEIRHRFLHAGAGNKRNQRLRAIFQRTVGECPRR